MSQPSHVELESTARRIRRRVIELSYSSKSGHIGSSLSCVDLLVGLFGRFLRLSADPSWAERDRFIMSKGHACVPYYCCLEGKGYLPRETLDEYGIDGGLLGHHPKRNPKFGIEIGTGSLGHGLSVACGLALGAKLQRRDWRSAVMMSDGEHNEGSVWEAAMFAAQHHLDNLLAVVDFNHMQALGSSSDILGIEPLHERYSAFGWGVRRIPGHDLGQIVSTLGEFPFVSGRPSVIIADTIKGKGVSFMENSLLWHYRCPDDAEFAAALKELPLA